MSRVVTFKPGMEPIGEAVIAIGVFDGVHLGHQALLRAAAAQARELGCASVALTFDRDPDQVIDPSTAAPQLQTVADKIAAIEACGVDVVFVVPFDHDVAALSPECFIDDVVVHAATPRAVHVGADFRFGARAAGTVDTLSDLGATHGFGVTAHTLLEVDGAPVTSTRIRGLVAGGDIERATRLLGGFPRLTGTVHEGRKQGRALGFPTANTLPAPFSALPADGVYAAFVTLADGSRWPAAVSVGVPPTFPEARDYVEAHLIGFDGDLYGQTLAIDFITRLRTQRAFASLPELTAAIAADVERAARTAAEAGK